MSYSATLTGSGWQVDPITPQVPPADVAVLFYRKGVDMNSVADQQLTRAFQFKEYLIDRIVVTNASISLSAALGGVYTAAAKGGVALVAASQGYAALTDAAKALGLTLAVTDKRTESTPPFLSLSTPQGAAATADIYVIGTPLYPVT